MFDNIFLEIYAPNLNFVSLPYAYKKATALFVSLCICNNDLVRSYTPPQSSEIKDSGLMK